MITIETCEQVDGDLVDAFARLIPQLSSSSPPPDAGALERIVDSPATTLLIATNDDGVVVGTLTLVLFEIPTGMRAWIEDVVVDEAAGRQGIGARLNERAIELAVEAGAKSIDLTSRPSRQAANRLYQRLGFAARETNVYRYSA